MAEIGKMDWARHTKKALKQWHQLVALSQNPLIKLNVVKRLVEQDNYDSDLYGNAKALRDILREGIRSLGVEGVEPPKEDEDPKWLDVAWRHYSLLTLQYVKGLSRVSVQDRIGLAEGGQYYRDQRKAIEMLASVLREWEGMPIHEASSESLVYPSGAVKLADSFYIERKADADLSYELRKPGITVTIRGPRQVGKTSLLIRGIQESRRRYHTSVVYIDLQSIGPGSLTSLDIFLHEFANHIVDELELDPDAVEKVWNGKLGTQRKLTKLFTQYILSEVDTPILLAMDELDRLLLAGFHTEFFGLLRSWHNRRAQYDQWDRLSMLMAISTEPYLLIDDMMQSPFNVGLSLHLEDFNIAQVNELNQRYGLPVNASEIPHVMAWLNGHPYLTRIALYTMAKEGLSWPDLVAIAPNDEGPFREHLQYLNQLLAPDSKLKDAFMQVMRHEKCSDDNARFRLLKAGLIEVSGETCSCRCELYRKYFAGKL